MENVENQLQAFCKDQSWSQATTLAIESYGPEVTGYLMAMLKNESNVQDVFANVCESLWLGLPKFRWECSLRTWLYVLARHAVSHWARDPALKTGKLVPLSLAPEILQLTERVRTTTLAFLRTEVKDRLASLREQLDPEEQSLFILRINRGLSWNDIALILSGESELDPEEQKQQAARLRKRFERAKDTIRRLAREQGLLQ